MEGGKHHCDGCGRAVEACAVRAAGARFVSAPLRIVKAVNKSVRDSCLEPLLGS